MQRLRLPLSLAAASALLVPAVAMAVPDAGSKARGDYNFFGHSAHTAFSSARGHVESYQRYLSDTHGIAMPAGGAKIVGTPVVGTPVIGTPAPVVTSAAPAAQPAAPVMQLASPAEQITAHGAVDPANPHETILITSRPGIASGPVAMDEIAGMVKSLFGCGDNS
jgi:hypothetical protein